MVGGRGFGSGGVEHSCESLGNGRDAVGLEHILFETDYPHTDGTFPESQAVAHRLCEGAGMDADECYAFLRGNAIRAYGLERFGITS